MNIKSLSFALVFGASIFYATNALADCYDNCAGDKVADPDACYASCSGCVSTESIKKEWLNDIKTCKEVNIIKDDTASNQGKCCLFELYCQDKPEICCLRTTESGCNTSMGYREVDCSSNKTYCPQASKSPAASATSSPAASSSSVAIKNPIAYDSVEGFLRNFLTVLQKVIVLLSMVFIVIGAVMYIVSAGTGLVETAKKTITAALVGLALGIAAPSFLKEISLILGWKGDIGPAADSLTITQIAINVLNFLLGAVGILAIIMLVIGGSMYLTSAGNENRIDKGKDIVKASIFGVIISLSALVLVRQLVKFFM